MTVEGQRSNQTPEPDLIFIRTDLQDVVPHDNDPSSSPELTCKDVVTTCRKVHHVLVDQGSSRRDVMFDLQRAAVVP